MLNENRFLGTFRGYSTQTSAANAEMLFYWNATRFFFSKLAFSISLFRSFKSFFAFLIWPKCSGCLFFSPHIKDVHSRAEHCIHRCCDFHLPYVHKCGNCHKLFFICSSMHQLVNFHTSMQASMADGRSFVSSDAKLSDVEENTTRNVESKRANNIKVKVS